MPEPRRQRSPEAGTEGAATTRSAPGKTSPPFWRTLLGRRVLAIVVLAAAAAIEWQLVNLPSGEVAGQFPATVKARDEVVTFGDPGSVTGGAFSFSYSPPTEAEKVLVDAYFDNAQLAPATLDAFKSFQIAAPSSAGLVTYITSSEGSAACSTKISVEPAGASLSSVEFWQTGSDITSGYRSLGASFAGAGAVVTLTSQGAMQNGLSPCRIELSVGDWKQATQGFMPIKINVPAGAAFRFHWENIDEHSSAWKTRSSALGLLAFGASDSDEFTAQNIAISRLDPKTGKPSAPGFEARGAKNAPLTVSTFGINQNQLEISASGRGKVLKGGRVASTINILETLNKNPILSALFGAANLALIGWAGRMFFPAKKKKKTAATAD